MGTLRDFCYVFDKKKNISSYLINKYTIFPFFRKILCFEEKLEELNLGIFQIQNRHKNWMAAFGWSFGILFDRKRVKASFCINKYTIFHDEVFWNRHKNWKIAFRWGFCNEFDKRIVISSYFIEKYSIFPFIRKILHFWENSQNNYCNCSILKST